LALEQLFATKLLVWGALCVIAGSAILALRGLRNTGSVLVGAFATQLAVLGAIEIVVALFVRSQSGLRDLSLAVSLDRTAWFAIGLETGFVASGVLVTILGWRLGRRLALVGTGIALSLHAAALTLLTLQLAASIVR